MGSEKDMAPVEYKALNALEAAENLQHRDVSSCIEGERPATHQLTCMIMGIRSSLLWSGPKNNFLSGPWMVFQR